MDRIYKIKHDTKVDYLVNPENPAKKANSFELWLLQIFRSVLRLNRRGQLVQFEYCRGPEKLRHRYPGLDPSL